MERVTERIKQIDKVETMVGRVLNSNTFPTLLGRLLYVVNERCYFEMLANPDYPKYNECAGQIEYLPEAMVVCMNFENE